MSIETSNLQFNASIPEQIPSRRLRSSRIRTLFTGLALIGLTTSCESQSKASHASQQNVTGLNLKSPPPTVENNTSSNRIPLAKLCDFEKISQIFSDYFAVPISEVTCTDASTPEDGSTLGGDFGNWYVPNDPASADIHTHNYITINIGPDKLPSGQSLFDGITSMAASNQNNTHKTTDINGRPAYLTTTNQRLSAPTIYTHWLNDLDVSVVLGSPDIALVTDKQTSDTLGQLATQIENWVQSQPA